VLAPTDQLTNHDWGDLLLLCGDCASSVSNFNPQTSYFWPDTSDAQENPYLYNRVDNVTITAQGPDGAVLTQPTTSVILVSISTDISQEIKTKALNTYELFRLNGRFFNENTQQPGYNLTYAEYVRPTDARLDQRMDAYLRAVEAAGTLARGIPTLEFGTAYLQNILAMINLAVNSFGFLSTWQAAIIANLNATDQALLPQLIALMTGQRPPTPPLDRKRTATRLDEGVQRATSVASAKRSKIETALGQIIASQS
jgi:hypothetical protein